MFPCQVEDLLKQVEGASSEYSITIARDEDNNKDVMLLTVEADGKYDFEAVSARTAELFRSLIGVSPKVIVLPIGTLPRSEKKTKRVIDYRNN